MDFSSIVLSGGEMKVIATIGCIDALLERQSIDNIRNFIGTSAGALLCCALCMGYTPKECLEFLHDELSKPEINKFDPLEILNIFETFGCSSGHNLDLLIQHLFSKKKFSKDITFIEFAKHTGKNLVVCGANITKESPEFFCVDNTPSMSVFLAVRISCNIPIIFNPIRYDGCLYADGMIYNNFPIDYFQPNKLRDIFAVNIFRKNMDFEGSFAKYFVNLMFSIQRLLTKYTLKSSREANIVTIDLNNDLSYFDMGKMEINITMEKLKEFYDKGYEQAKQQLTEIGIMGSGSSVQEAG